MALLRFLIAIWASFLFKAGVATLDTQRDGTVTETTREGVSNELFNSLEELSRIVDITYCVGATGIYKPFRCAGRCHEFEGFELIETWNTGPLLSDSCGYLALSHSPWKKRIILAFRGTYSIANTIVDLSAVPQVYVPYHPENSTSPRPPDDDDKRNGRKPKCTNCTVHAGFMQSWQNTRSAILEPLSEAIAKYPDYELVVVGHSLGGAVAALAGLEFQLRGWNPQITTFGEPRVGNRGLVDYIDKQFNLLPAEAPNKGNRLEGRSSFRRITHVNDPVPLLPLSEWGYAMHAGEIFISKSDLPPSPVDLRICHGDADPACIANGSQEEQWHKVRKLQERSLKKEAVSKLPRRETEDRYGDQQEDYQHQLSPAESENTDESINVEVAIPARYKLWELFFAHRDYFNRLGVCLPSPGDFFGPGCEKDRGPWWKRAWRWPWPWGRKC